MILGQIAYAKAQVANPTVQLENAIALMNESIEENMDDETISYNFGVVSGIINEGAQEELRQIGKEAEQNMRQNPDDIQAHLELAVVYGGYAAEYENLAMQYERNGQLDKATKELDKATKNLIRQQRNLKNCLDAIRADPKFTSFSVGIMNVKNVTRMPFAPMND